MNFPGVLLVLEGSDGSGKGTQFSLLSERLKAAGYDVAVFDFPRYDKDSSHFVKQYLNGGYGPASEVSPYTASLFYALDRYEAANDIKAELAQGKVVLCNRYVGSNMAHQGAKFTDPVEQRGFFVWEDNLEYELLGIPRPDLSIYLRVPAEISQELIAKKTKRDYTSASHDQHEADLEFMKKSVATYDLLCQLFPKDFLAIDCTKNSQLLSIPQVSNLIWEKIKPLLPEKKPHNGHNAIVTLGQDAPKAQQDDAANDSNKLVHKFSNASLHLKLNIERHIKSVEPSGLSIWSDNNYQFYTPAGLPKPLEAEYKRAMQVISDNHIKMRQKLEAYYEKNLITAAQRPKTLPNISQLLLPATPMAALCTFSASFSDKAVGRVSQAFLSSDSPELQWCAQQVYLAARKKWPSQFKAPLESDVAPEALGNIISKLAEDKLPLNSSEISGVSLLDASPKQEFDLLAESIYPYSNLSLDEIVDEVSGWSYAQKYESLKSAANDPELLMEKISYKFDLMTDHIVFAELTSQLGDSNPQSQNPSPRNGYDVPEALEEAGIDELYISCFDESLALYSLMQKAERDDLAIYATLLGHKLRWQLNINAAGLKQLFDNKSDTLFQIADKMREKVTEAHPLIWEVLYPSGNITALETPKNRVKPYKRRPSKKRR